MLIVSIVQHPSSTSTVHLVREGDLKKITKTVTTMSNVTAREESDIVSYQMPQQDDPAILDVSTHMGDPITTIRTDTDETMEVEDFNTPSENDPVPEVIVSAPVRESLTAHMRSIAPHGYKPNTCRILAMPQFIKPLPPLSLSDFQCKVCQGIIDRPLELNCGHVFCADCLLEEARDSQVMSCISCGSRVSQASAIRAPHYIVLQSLGSLQFLCSCRRAIALYKLAQHVAICSSHNTAGRQSVTPGRQAALTREFQISITQTPTSIDRKAACHTMRRLMQSSSSQHASPTHLQIQAGGQVH